MGRSVIVTGAASGIGRATADKLRAGGDDVLEVDLHEGFTADLTTREGNRAAVDEALSRFGRLDVVVNNAGGQYFVPAEAIALKGWQAVTRLNVGGTLTMSEVAFERAMRAAGQGIVVNVTLSPHHGLAGMTHSSAARAAVEGVTRELAHAWAGDGVAVCAAAAGHYDTPSLRKYPEQVWKSAARTVPLQRLGRMEEHAWLIALLASPLGRRLSGAVITLDGARDNWFGPWPPTGMTDETGEVPTEARRR
jgi:citronellol/citronellal dehydrogenase